MAALAWLGFAASSWHGQDGLGAERRDLAWSGEAVMAAQASVQRGKSVLGADRNGSAVADRSAVEGHGREWLGWAVAAELGKAGHVGARMGSAVAEWFISHVLSGLGSAATGRGVEGRDQSTQDLDRLIAESLGRSRHGSRVVASPRKARIAVRAGSGDAGHGREAQGSDGRAWLGSARQSLAGASCAW